MAGHHRHAKVDHGTCDRPVVAGQAVEYFELERLFTSREAKGGGDERRGPTSGTPLCRDTPCRVRTDEECNAEIARMSTVS